MPVFMYGFYNGNINAAHPNISCDFQIEDYHTRLSSNSHFKLREIFICFSATYYFCLFTKWRKKMRPYYNILIIISNQSSSVQKVAENWILWWLYMENSHSRWTLSTSFSIGIIFITSQFLAKKFFSDWYLNQVDRNLQFS